MRARWPRLCDLPTGTKLGLGFAAVLVLMLGMAGISVRQQYAAASANAALERLTAHATAVQQWHAHTTTNLTRALSLAQSGYQPALAAFLEPQMKVASQHITELQKQVQAQIESASERALFEDIGQKRKTYVDVRAQAVEHFKAGAQEAGLQLVEGPMRAHADAYLESLSRLNDHVAAEATALREAGRAASERAMHMLLALATMALVCGTALAVSISRAIVLPLRRSVAAAHRIAEGHLHEDLRAGDRADELGTLERALADMQQHLNAMVTQIRESTDAITLASAEIATGNADLSVRTEMAASSLQETASSMEELTGTVRHTAQASQSAAGLASSACAIAQRGGEVVGEVVSTMASINEGARRISDITGVIDGIAFQTNILALNAAVESARAGEHGRGFAVVASEVRALAQRSAEAAREIKALISTSVDRVEAGTQLVNGAGATMLDIVDSVRKVSGIVEEISHATGEQSTGIDQVNIAVAQLDQATQQNAALVEEAAAAAASMREQAQKLQQVVARFQLT